MHIQCQDCFQLKGGRIAESGMFEMLTSTHIHTTVTETESSSCNKVISHNIAYQGRWFLFHRGQCLIHAKIQKGGWPPITCKQWGTLSLNRGENWSLGGRCTMSCKHAAPDVISYSFTIQNDLHTRVVCSFTIYMHTVVWYMYMLMIEKM